MHTTARADPMPEWVIVNKSTMGKKGVCCILKSQEIRRAFLSAGSHRVCFVYLPKHSSWQNQIEIVFDIKTPQKDLLLQPFSIPSCWPRSAISPLTRLNNRQHATQDASSIS